MQVRSCVEEDFVRTRRKKKFEFFDRNRFVEFMLSKTSVMNFEQFFLFDSFREVAMPTSSTFFSFDESSNMFPKIHNEFFTFFF